MDQKKPGRLSRLFFLCRKRSFFLPHIAIVALEILAIVYLLAAGAFSILLWRLHQGPMDVTFTKNYIEAALYDPHQKLNPSVENIVLSWPEMKGPLLLAFKNASLYDDGGAQLVKIQEMALSLSKAALLIGRVSPVALIIHDPVITLTRMPDGSINLGPFAFKTSSAEPRLSPGDFIQKIKTYINFPRTPVHTTGNGLSGFKIVNGQVMIDDPALHATWTAQKIDASLENGPHGLTGNADIILSDSREAPSYLKMNLSLPLDLSQGQLRAELKNFDPWFFAQKIDPFSPQHKGESIFNVELAAVIDAALHPQRALFQIVSPKGILANKNPAIRQIDYNNLLVNGELDGNAHRFAITDLGFNAQGITFRGNASFNTGDGWIAGAAHLSIPDIAQSKLAEIWPPDMKENAAYEWAVHNIADGTFKNLHLDADLNAIQGDSGAWSFKAKNVLSSFDYDDMTINYRAPLPPIKNAEGNARFFVDQERLDIRVTGGQINDLDVKGGQAELARILTPNKGVADLHMHLAGPLKSALRYLSLGPINMKHRFDIDHVSGQTDVSVNLGFPYLHDVKIGDVRLNVVGSMKDINVPSIINDLGLTGGPYTIELKDNLLNVAGNGAFGGAAGDFVYKTYIEGDNNPFNMSVVAHVNTTPALRKSLGADIEDFVDNDFPADVNYTSYEDHHATADIKADLTPAHVIFDPLNYSKAPGAAGSASLKLNLQNDTVKNIENLVVNAPDLSVQDAGFVFHEDSGHSKIESGHIGAFTVGKTKGEVKLNVETSGLYKLNIASPVFDLAPVMAPGSRKKPYAGPPMQIDMTAGAMKGADGGQLGPAEFHILRDSQGRYDDFEINAALDGKSKAALVFKPGDKGIRTFSFQTDDAGAMLRAFGIYNNLVGGAINIQGQARGTGDGPEGRDIYGEAVITNFKVVHAPTLARLIGALSLPGILNLLENEGLPFSKLQANYAWQYRPQGSLITLQEGRTSGNAVGITFGGTIDQSNATVDMEGTAIPLATINKMIGKIPLVGNLLTGGGNGIFAATYTLKGPAAQPDISVNPLSVLAPGIVRKILFQ